MTTTPALFDTPGDPRQPTAEHPLAWIAHTTWRDAIPTRCPHCRRPTLTGYNDNQCAFRVQVDITPLDIHHQALAWLTQRNCYHIHLIGNRVHIRRLNQWNAAAPALRNMHVVPAHRCNSGTEASCPFPNPGSHTPAPDAPAPF